MSQGKRLTYGAVHHVALRVSDPERAARFYARLGAIPERRRLHDESGAVRAIWLDAGGTVLMLERELRGAGPAAGSGHVLALAIPDMAAAEEAAERAGAVVDDRTRWTLYVRDPDGHRVGLCAHPGLLDEVTS